MTPWFLILADRESGSFTNLTTIGKCLTSPFHILRRRPIRRPRHGGDPKKHEKLKIINRFHIEQFAYLLGKLISLKDGAGTLLDNAMLAYGSGISDGDRHNHDNLPILLCSKGGGTIRPGRHLKVAPQPLNNLYLSMLDRMETPVIRLGYSTGWLSQL